MGRFLTLISAVIALAVGPGCSPGVGSDPGVGGISYSAAFKQQLDQQPELIDALARIDVGDCSQALPLLTVYGGQDSQTEMLDYLLGRAYLCTGDFRKGSHHLTKAWIGSPDLHTEIRAAAFQGARKLTALLAAGGSLSYEFLQAGFQLHAFGTTKWYSAESVALLQAYAGRVEQRGNFKQILKVVKVMKRIGTTTVETFATEAMALVHLGEQEKLETLVNSSIVDLGEKAPEIIYAIAREAENAYRQEIAAALYSRCLDIQCPQEELHLDLARSYLKANHHEQAQTAYRSYLQKATPEQLPGRILAVGLLLQKYEQHELALTELEAGRKAFPKEFRFARAIAALQEKLPGKVDVRKVFGTYLETCSFDITSIENVGAQCLQWKLLETGAALMKTVPGTETSRELKLFYGGAFLWLQGKQDKATKLFDGAVDAATNREALLDRIASLVISAGQPEAAKNYFARALKRNPGVVPIMLKLASLEEAENAGNGPAYLARQSRKRAPDSNGLRHFAEWCATNDYPDDAISYAQKAVTAAASKTTDKTALTAAHLLLGELLMESAGADLEPAVEQLRRAFAASPDPMTTGPRIMQLPRLSEEPAAACLGWELAQTLRKQDRLENPLMEKAVILSLVCGSPDDVLVHEYVSSGKEPGAPLLIILPYCTSGAAREVLFRTVENGPDSWWQNSSVVQALTVHFATVGQSGNALQFAERLVSAGLSQADLVTTGRDVLVAGATDAARVLFTAAWQKNAPSIGTIPPDYLIPLASLLFANGEDNRAFAALQAYLSAPFVYGRAAAANVAGLLIDAGRPARAEEVCLEGLRTSAQAAPTPGNHMKEPGSKALSREDLLSLISASVGTSDPEQENRQLIALLAIAWRDQNKDWDDFVKVILPLVEPWHGEHLVAGILHHLGIHEQALRLYQGAFKKSPAVFEMLKGYVNALVFRDHLSGHPFGHSNDLIRSAARRFIKARESDSDAYKTCAGFLEAKALYALAGELLDELAKTGTVESTLAMAMARNQMSLGQFDKASQSFKLAVQLGACGRKSVEPLINETERTGHHDLALQIIRDCAEKYPKDAFLHYQFARIRLDLAGPAALDEVLARLKKAVLQDETYREEAARLLISHGAAHEAWPFVELMIRAKTPGEALKGLEIGFQVASQQGDVERMTKMGSQVARFHRKEKPVLAEIAGLYFRYNLMDQGLEKLRSSLQHDDDFTALLLGIRLVSLGRTEEGLKRFRDYAEKHYGNTTKRPGDMPPKEFKTLSVQLDFLDDMVLFSESAQLLDKAVKVYPDDSRLQTRLLASLLLKGQSKPVLEQLPVLLNQWPRGQAWQQQQRVLRQLRKQGKLLQAIETMEKNCRASFSNGCLPALLYAHALEGNTERLERLVTRAQEQISFYPKLRDLAGMLSDTGQRTPALRLLQTYVRRQWGVWSGLLDAHGDLAKLYSALKEREKMADLTRLVLLQVGSAASEVDPVEARHSLAVQLKEQEYTTAATRQFQLLDLLDEEMPKAQLHLFEIHLREGRNTEASQLALRTAFMGDNVLNVMITFASLARRMLSFDLAYELYLAAHELDSTNQALLFAVAELALVLNKPDIAKEKYMAYIGADAGSERRRQEVTQNCAKYNHFLLASEFAAAAQTPAVALELGLNHLRAGFADEGHNLVDKALKQAGKGAQQTARKALEYGLVRRYLFSDKLLAKLLKIGCDSKSTEPVLCRFWAGQTALMKGRTKEALDAFEGQLKGSNETWRYTLAAFRSLLRVGEAGKADHLLQKRMVGFSRTQVLSEALKTLFVLLEEEQVDSSVRDSIVSLGDSYVKELLAIQPYDFWYQTQAAELQILAGNQKKALKMYLDFLRETPWVPGLANNLAYLYSKADTNLGEAMQLVRKAQEGEPSHSAFYLDTEGWVLFKQGKLEEAEKQIQRAINRSHLGFGDALSESIYHLGIVQLARGNKDRAQQTFAIAGFLDPYGEYGQLARAELRKLTADPFNMQ